MLTIITIKEGNLIHWLVYVGYSGGSRGYYLSPLLTNKAGILCLSNYLREDDAIIIINQEDIRCRQVFHRINEGYAELITGGNYLFQYHLAGVGIHHPQHMLRVNANTSDYPKQNDKYSYHK